MFSALKAKLIAASALIMSILYMLLKREKRKRKQAEQDAAIQKHNSEQFERANEIASELAIDKDEFEKSQEKVHNEKIETLEDLKNENDDTAVINTINSLLNKNNSKN